MVKNQLIQVQILASMGGQVLEQVNYQYDVLGRRIVKSVVDNVDSSKSYGRKYQYDGDEAFAELDSSNALLAQYLFSKLQPDDVLSMKVTQAGVNAGFAPATGIFYFLKDSLGSVTDIVDNAGNLRQHFDYSSFGNLLRMTNGAGTDITIAPLFKSSFTYTGREPERESGLMYYRARYYDPSIGRFLQQDLEPGKLENPITHINRYSYVGNNPLVYTDPSGKIFGIDDIVFLICSAVIGGFLKDYDTHSGNFFTNFFEGAFDGAIAGAALIGVYYGVNGIVNAAANLFEDFRFFTEDFSHFAGAVRQGFQAESSLGTWTASIITAPAIPGMFSNVGAYNGYLQADDTSKGYAQNISYLGYLTAGAAAGGWKIPIQTSWFKELTK